MLLDKVLGKRVMGMSTTDCSEGILNPWTKTDSSRQCDAFQSAGSDELSTLYMAVSVVLLLYNIGILAYLASRGIEKGVQNRKIRLASTIGGIASVASYFAVKFWPPLNAILSNNVPYGIMSGIAIFIGLTNVVIAIGFLEESGPSLFRRSRKSAKYNQYYDQYNTFYEEHRSSTNNRFAGNWTLEVTDTSSQMSWSALNQCEPPIKPDNSNVPSTCESIISSNKNYTSTLIDDKKPIKHFNSNLTDIAMHSNQKNLERHAYLQTSNDAVRSNLWPIIMRAENAQSTSIVKLLKDPVLSMKIVRRAVKMLNEGIIVDRDLYRDHLHYLKTQDAILIWILGERPIKFVKRAPLYHKLATKRTLQRLKSLRLIENTKGIPRLSERGRMVREAIRLAAESLWEDPRARRGASPVTVT
jgi:hypothetical protein